ncbi:MAG: YbaB/EbfC family nucleoid-associated protein [Deltaproteobacteria bacterium]|nr:YbaB/EbfC family nucleoid-associated protein [Deltaproteobacteria bacterium]
MDDDNQGKGPPAMDIGKLVDMAKGMATKFNQVQEELSSVMVEGSSGGGMVKVKANAKGEILDIVIEKDAVDPGDLSLLQDLVVAAVNQALVAARKEAQQRTMGLTAGLNIQIPGFTV